LTSAYVAAARERQQRGSVYGANRLAIEALPLFRCVPRGGVLRTTGFREQRRTDGRNDVRFRWPVWTPWLSLNAVRSMLAVATSEDADTLRRRGVDARFESQRLTIGKFRCFSPAEPV
jgi:hypothetical protein